MIQLTCYAWRRRRWWYNDAVRHTWTNFCGCKTLDQINRNNCRNVLLDTWMTHIQLHQPEWYVWIYVRKSEAKKTIENANRIRCVVKHQDGGIGGQWEAGRCICLIETKRGHIKFYWWQTSNATWLKYIYTRRHHCMGVFVCMRSTSPTEIENIFKWQWHAASKNEHESESGGVNEKTEIQFSDHDPVIHLVN